jgi:hypothetical protein
MRAHGRPGVRRQRRHRPGLDLTRLFLPAAPPGFSLFAAGRRAPSRGRRRRRRRRDEGSRRAWPGRPGGAAAGGAGQEATLSRGRGQPPNFFSVAPRGERVRAAGWPSRPDATRVAGWTRGQPCRRGGAPTLLPTLPTPPRPRPSRRGRRGIQRQSGTMSVTLETVREGGEGSMTAART